MYVYMHVNTQCTQGMLTGSWTTKISKRRFFKIIGSET